MLWKPRHPLRLWLPLRRGLGPIMALAMSIVSFAFIVTFYVCNLAGHGSSSSQQPSTPLNSLSNSIQILHESTDDNIFVFDQTTKIKGEVVIERCLSRTPPDLEHPGLSAFETCMNVQYPERLILPYVRLIFGALYLLEPDALQNVLLIGLGGGSFPKSLETILRPRRLDIDIVEIDETVVQVAREWFNFTSNRNTHIYIEDGADFVARALPGSYDLIVVDAYDKDDQIPAAIISQECLAHMRRALRSDGVLAVNVYNNSEFQLKTLRVKLEVSFGGGSGSGAAAQIYELKMDESVVLLAVVHDSEGDFINLDAIKRRAHVLEVRFKQINIDKSWLLNKFISVAQD